MNPIPKAQPMTQGELDEIANLPDSAIAAAFRDVAARNYSTCYASLFRAHVIEKARTLGVGDRCAKCKGTGRIEPAGVTGTLNEQRETTMDADSFNTNGLAWAVSRWNDEVKHRPLVNVHRRTLDDTWRQVVRYFGGDPDKLLGPSHDTLHMQAQEARAWKP